MAYKSMYELPCCDSRKSFYGKAHVIEDTNGRYLLSYDTRVCFVGNDGSFVKLWDGYSATTMRHINSFMRHVGMSGCNGKKWWDSLDVDARYRINEAHQMEAIA